MVRGRRKKFGGLDNFEHGHLELKLSARCVGFSFSLFLSSFPIQQSCVCPTPPILLAYCQSKADVFQPLLSCPLLHACNRDSYCSLNIPCASCIPSLLWVWLGPHTNSDQWIGKRSDRRNFWDKAVKSSMSLLSLSFIGWHILQMIDEASVGNCIRFYVSKKQAFVVFGLWDIGISLLLHSV